MKYDAGKEYEEWRKQVAIAGYTRPPIMRTRAFTLTHQPEAHQAQLLFVWELRVTVTSRIEKLQIICDRPEGLVLSLKAGSSSVFPNELPVGCFVVPREIHIPTMTVGGVYSLQLDVPAYGVVADLLEID